MQADEAHRQPVHYRSMPSGQAFVVRHLNEESKRSETDQNFHTNVVLLALGFNN
jgi:hypothetical protein